MTPTPSSSGQLAGVERSARDTYVRGQPELRPAPEAYSDLCGVCTHHLSQPCRRRMLSRERLSGKLPSDNFLCTSKYMKACSDARLLFFLAGLLLLISWTPLPPPPSPSPLLHLHLLLLLLLLLLRC